MNNLKNKVMLIGNLGNDPVVKEFTGGKKMATFSIATSEYYRNAKGERMQDTQWHRIVVWGNVATIAENYLKKGQEVAVEGKLVHRQYEDQQGVQRYITEVNVGELALLNNRRSE